MSENCGNCPLLPRVEVLEEANRQHSDTHREVFGRLNKLEMLSAVQENKLDTILKKLDEITDKVDALEAKPGKRWDGLVDKVLWAVAGAVIAFLLAGLGL